MIFKASQGLLLPLRNENRRARAYKRSWVIDCEVVPNGTPPTGQFGVLTGVFTTAFIQSFSNDFVMRCFCECRGLLTSRIHQRYYGCQHRQYHVTSGSFQFSRSIWLKAALPPLSHCPLPLTLSGFRQVHR